MASHPYIKVFTVDDIKVFNDCPVKWYLLHKANKIHNQEHQVMKDIMTYYLCKRMSGNFVNKTMMESRILKSKDELKKYRNVKKWMMAMMKFFSNKILDIRCINLPFNVMFQGQVEVTGTIDIINKSNFGIDIVMYDFNEKFDLESLENDPSFLIYILACNETFKEEINSINVFNVPKTKYYDISRRTQIMCDQMDDLKDLLNDMYNNNIVPKTSLQCDKCKTKVKCFTEYYKINEEIKKND